MRILTADKARSCARQGLAALLCALAGLLPGASWADLMLFPTRVVFDKSDRAAQVELINTGQERATYRITLVNRRMTETGEFTSADPPLAGEQFASEFIRYSPRQVVLAPGASQTVRLLLRKPSGLPTGEYRSHLQFSLVPEPGGSANLAQRDAPQAADEVGVQLRALMGVSIPVIVRQGETSAQVRLGDVQLRPANNAEPPVLAVVIERGGNRSVYGDLVVKFTDAAGNPREVGRAAGVAVYTPNASRRVSLALPPDTGPLLRAGTLALSFVQRPEEGGKTLAQTSLQLP
jgi:fimbrial chaperone protein